MKTILFTNARDESKILEWVVHHQNLGFTHIYIFDHKSISPIKNILKNNTNVTVNRIDTNIIKARLIINAHKVAVTKKYDWMLYLDSDEFLILNKHDKVSDFLNMYNNYDQVGINWLMFGSNNLNNKLNNDQTMLESYTKCQNRLNPHIKTFLNLRNKKVWPLTPHVYKLKNMNKSVDVEFKPLNKKTPYFNHIGKSYNDVTAYIAHYYYQSYETYISRKIKLPRDDNNKYRSVISKEQFHKLSNNKENLYPCNKYNAINKAKLKDK